MDIHKFLEMPESDLLAACQPSKCSGCGVTLHESTTGIRKEIREYQEKPGAPAVAKEVCVCSDCYYASFDSVIEQDPIFRPRRLH